MKNSQLRQDSHSPPSSMMKIKKKKKSSVGYKHCSLAGRLAGWLVEWSAGLVLVMGLVGQRCVMQPLADYLQTPASPSMLMPTHAPYP